MRSTWKSFANIQTSIPVNKCFVKINHFGLTLEVTLLKLKKIKITRPRAFNVGSFEETFSRSNRSDFSENLRPLE